ncbi:hypothetical protein L202_07518 [Cryptococcus amylolentus CBS 6039]|uniref:Uncharacterized protein n=2 Tax=Cryptococcus amylolentus TaxID=104669 RepID=A0A1E3HCH7_9TREE|nr:hypothetical protein L202_07518 [Cryptococcus amylolentus CBS 6039]ODN74047.1 hypothetical protein L202_07518 [Cryptococcus amylolentus CBS 6039]ODO00157.1 hypothetical protein I350_06782 [Cryptococcus amylolentus CBS 6273]
MPAQSPIPPPAGIPDRSRKIPAYKTYTGPDPSTLSGPRSKSQAEQYFAKGAHETILPKRVSKAIGFGGWFFGGVAAVYMVLFADFGDREHVFSPVRREYIRTKQSFFTLTPEERKTMGLETRIGESEAGKQPS